MVTILKRLVISLLLMTIVVPTYKYLTPVTAHAEEGKEERVYDENPDKKDVQYTTDGEDVEAPKTPLDEKKDEFKKQASKRKTTRTVFGIIQILIILAMVYWVVVLIAYVASNFSGIDLVARITLGGISVADPAAKKRFIWSSIFALIIIGTYITGVFYLLVMKFVEVVLRLLEYLKIM